MAYEPLSTPDPVGKQSGGSTVTSESSKAAASDFRFRLVSEGDKANILSKSFSLNYLFRRLRLSRQELAEFDSERSSKAGLVHSDSFNSNDTTVRQSSAANSEQDSVSIPRHGDYSSSKTVPYSKKRIQVFPEAGEDLSKAHRDRFPVLVDLFRRIVQQDPGLNNCVGFISYELRICGQREVDAQPSILVFCPKSMLRKLKAILSESHIKEQYDPQLSETVHTPARFQLVFWAQEIQLLSSPVLEYQVPSQLSILPNSLCGSRVISVHGNDKRYSTLACLVYINGQAYGLTTSHAIHDIPTSGSQEDILDMDVPIDAGKLDDSEALDDDSDDEYDLSDARPDDEALEIGKVLSSEASYAKANEAHLVRRGPSGLTKAMPCPGSYPSADQSQIHRKLYGDYAGCQSGHKLQKNYSIKHQSVTKTLTLGSPALVHIHSGFLPLLTSPPNIYASYRDSKIRGTCYDTATYLKRWHFQLTPTSRNSQSLKSAATKAPFIQDLKLWLYERILQNSWYTTQAVLNFEGPMDKDMDTCNDVIASTVESPPVGVRSPNIEEAESSIDLWEQRSSSPKHYKSIECKVRGPSLDSEWKASHCNLDWALLGIPDRRLWLLNVYTDPENSRLRTVSGVCDEIVTKRTVHIVVSPDTSYTGQVKETVYVSGRPGSKPTKLWALSQLSNDAALKKGNSGALVIDAATAQVCGQVIARSPLNELYFAPMVDIIAQISEVFHTDRVSLTSFIPDLENYQKINQMRVDRIKSMKEERDLVNKTFERVESGVGIIEGALEAAPRRLQESTRIIHNSFSQALKCKRISTVQPSTQGRDSNLPSLERFQSSETC